MPAPGMGGERSTAIEGEFLVSPITSTQVKEPCATIPSARANHAWYT